MLTLQSITQHSLTSGCVRAGRGLLRTACMIATVAGGCVTLAAATGPHVPPGEEPVVVQTVTVPSAHGPSGEKPVLEPSVEGASFVSGARDESRPQGSSAERTTNITSVVSGDRGRKLGVPQAATRAEQGSAGGTNTPAASASTAMLPTIGALAAVVGAILVCGWVTRRLLPTSSLMLSLGKHGRAPSGILEVLGRYPLSRGCTLILLKLDRRIVLVSQSGGRGGVTLSTLCEVTDVSEVASIISKAGGESGFIASLAKAKATPAEGAAMVNSVGAPAAGASPQHNITRTAAAPVKRVGMGTNVPAAAVVPASPTVTSHPHRPIFIPTTQDGASAAATLRKRLASMKQQNGGQSSVADESGQTIRGGVSVAEKVEVRRGSTLLPKGLAA
jgi:hypothetical protein